MKTVLIPLGTNGFIPSFGRQTMSFLLLRPNDVLLIDAGTGVSRLLDPAILPLLNKYERLNILLSHYHLDHVVGLAYLPGIWNRGPIVIHGPAKPIVNAEPRDAINQLLYPPLFSLPINDFPVPVEIVPITGNRIQIGDFSIATRRQRHPGGSMGIRIDDQIAYTTDTVVDQETAIFAQGVQLLLHEVWLTDAETVVDEIEHSGHSYVGGVAQIANKSKVRQLMPIHHHPKRSEEDINSIGSTLQGSVEADVVIPVEGKFYNIS